MWAWLHRWTGLAAGAWLAVVGITGVLLDHKDWRWMRQSLAPAWLVSPRLEQTARDLAIRQYQIDPADPRHRIAGGWRGMWVTFDAGAHWTEARFGGGAAPPLVHVAEASADWRTIALGTDAGLMTSTDGGRTYAAAAFDGAPVTGVARTEAAGAWLLVLDRSRLVVWREGQVAEPVDLDPPPAALLPPTESLSRIFSNLHLGLDLLPGAGSTLVWNDAAGVAFLVLPVTGFLYWRRWGRRFLGRFHGWWIGLPLAVPLLYLSVTGVYFVHRDTMASVLAQVPVARGWLPPAYRFRDGWDDAIGAAFVLPGGDGSTWPLAIATRRGLFAIAGPAIAGPDRSWRLLSPGSFWGGRRQGEVLLAFGPRNLRCELSMPAPVCRPAAGTGAHMISDAALEPDGTVAWLGHMGLHGGEAVPLPVPPGVPWQFVVNRIHAAAIPFGRFDWVVTDLAGLVLVLSVISGVTRLWRRVR